MVIFTFKTLKLNEKTVWKFIHDLWEQKERTDVKLTTNKRAEFVIM